MRLKIHWRRFGMPSRWGVDWLEFDVQMTKDGALVVIHDETVDRTTNGTGAVRDLTLEEIRSLDAGQGEKVPTFEEVVQLAKTNGVKILPETKSPEFYPGIEESFYNSWNKLIILTRLSLSRSMSIRWKHFIA